MTEPTPDPAIVRFDRKTTEGAAELRRLADEIEKGGKVKDTAATNAAALIRDAAELADSLVIGWDSQITYRAIPNQTQNQDFEVALMGDLWAMLRYETHETRKRIIEWLADRARQEAIQG